MIKSPVQILCLFLLCFSSLGIQAQNIHETILPAGGNANGSSGSVSYSVGQTVYTTNTGTNGSVAQGVQQPYEISVLDAIEEANGIDLIVTAYPNPTSDNLTLSISEFDFSNLLYQMYDATGKMVASEKVVDPKTSIDMNGLVSATYFLKIVQDGQIVKTFKIIKNK